MRSKRFAARIFLFIKKHWKKSFQVKKAIEQKKLKKKLEKKLEKSPLKINNEKCIYRMCRHKKKKKRRKNPHSHTHQHTNGEKNKILVMSSSKLA